MDGICDMLSLSLQEQLQYNYNERLSTSLQITNIQHIESHTVIKVKLLDVIYNHIYIYLALIRLVLNLNIII